MIFTSLPIYAEETVGEVVESQEDVTPPETPIVEGESDTQESNDENDSSSDKQTDTSESPQETGDVDESKEEVPSELLIDENNEESGDAPVEEVKTAEVPVASTTPEMVGAPVSFLVQDPTGLPFTGQVSVIFTGPISSGVAKLDVVGGILSESENFIMPGATHMMVMPTDNSFANSILYDVNAIPPVLEFQEPTMQGQFMYEDTPFPAGLLTYDALLPGFANIPLETGPIGAFKLAPFIAGLVVPQDIIITQNQYQPDIFTLLPNSNLEYKLYLNDPFNTKDFRIQVLKVDGTPYTGKVFYGVICTLNDMTSQWLKSTDIENGLLDFTVKFENETKFEFFVMPLDASEANSKLVDLTAFMNADGRTDLGQVNFQLPVTKGVLTNVKADANHGLGITYETPGLEDDYFTIDINDQYTFSLAPFNELHNGKVNISYSRRDGYRLRKTFDYNDKNIVIETKDLIKHDILLTDPSGNPYTGQVYYAFEGSGRHYYSSLVNNGKLSFEIPSSMDTVSKAFFYPEDGSYAATSDLDLSGYTTDTPKNDFGALAFRPATFTGHMYEGKTPMTHTTVTARFKKEGLPDDLHYIHLYDNNAVSFSPRSSDYDDELVIEIYGGNTYKKSFTYNEKDVVIDKNEGLFTVDLNILDLDGQPYTGDIVCSVVGDNVHTKFLYATNGKVTIELNTQNTYKFLYVYPADAHAANSKAVNLRQISPNQVLEDISFQVPLTRGTVLIDGSTGLKSMLDVHYNGDCHFMNYEVGTSGRFALAPLENHIPDQVYLCVLYKQYTSTGSYYDYDDKDILLKISTSEKILEGTIYASDRSLYNGTAMFTVIDKIDNSYNYSYYEVDVNQGQYSLDLTSLESPDFVYVYPKDMSDANSIEHVITGISYDQPKDFAFQAPSVGGTVYHNNQAVGGAYVEGVFDLDRPSVSVTVKSNDHGNFKLAPLDGIAGDKVNLSARNMDFFLEGKTFLTNDLNIRLDSSEVIDRLELSVLDGEDDLYGTYIISSGRYNVIYMPENSSGQISVKAYNAQNQPIDLSGQEIKLLRDEFYEHITFDGMNITTGSVDLMSRDSYLDLEVGIDNYNFKVIVYEGKLGLIELVDTESEVRDVDFSMAVKGDKIKQHSGNQYIKDQYVVLPLGENPSQALIHMTRADVHRSFVTAGTKLIYKDNFDLTDEFVNLGQVSFEDPIFTGHIVDVQGKAWDNALVLATIDTQGQYIEGLNDFTIKLPYYKGKFMLPNISDLVDNKFTFEASLGFNRRIISDIIDIKAQSSVTLQEIEEQLVLNGDSYIYLEAGAEYEDEGASYISSTGTEKILSKDTVDTSKVGTYELNYYKGDLRVVRTVEIGDITQPKLSLIGDETVIIEVFTPYEDHGANFTDNLDPAKVVYSEDNFNTSKVGTYVLNYQVSDANGNTSNKLQRTISVVDTTKPLITLNGDEEVTIYQSDMFVDPGASYTDNYDESGIVYTTTSYDVNIPDTYTLAYQYTDKSGNASEIVYRRLIVKEKHDPTLTLNGKSFIKIQLEGSYKDEGATFKDKDGNTSIVYSKDTLDTSVTGIKTLNYSVVDSYENLLTISRRIEVVDLIAPVITPVKGDERIEVFSNFEDAGANVVDNYDEARLIYSDSSVDTSKIGTYIIEYITSDKAGNEARTSRTVTVEDTISPVLTLNGESTIEIEVHGSFTDNGAAVSDNYDDDRTIMSSSEYNLSKPGTYVLEYLAEDTSGNKAVKVTRTLIVKDTTAPVLELIGEDIKVEVGSSYQDEGATFTDNYDKTYILYSEDTVDYSTPGNYELTYQVADSSENMSNKLVRTVDVKDTTKPQVSLIGDAHIILEVYDAYTDQGANVSDNYDEDSIIYSDDTFDTSKTGTYVLTYQAIDTSKNESEITKRTIEVKDTTAPKLVVIGPDVIVEVHGTYTDEGASFTDNYDEDKVVKANNTIDTSKVGIYELVYQVSDEAGNISNIEKRKVKVQDTTSPQITLNGQETITLEVKSLYEDLGASVLDNYDGEWTVQTSSEYDLNKVGTYTLRYQATDKAGNVSEEIQRTLIIEDTTAPDVTLIGEAITVEVHGKYTDEGAKVTDNYDEESIVKALNSVDTDFLGDYELRYQATDSEGNVSVEITRKVSVVDTTKPEVTLKGDHMVVLELGQDYDDPGVDMSDNYQNGQMTLTKDNKINKQVEGTYVIIYTVEDQSGNRTSAYRWVQVLNPEEQTAPTLKITGIVDGQLSNQPVVFDVHSDGTIGYKVKVNGEEREHVHMPFSENGEYEVTVFAHKHYPENKLETTQTIKFTVDTEGPVITSNIGGTYTSSVRPSVTVTDNMSKTEDITVTMTLNGSAYNNQSIGTANGQQENHTLVVTATDKAGNVSTKTFNFATKIPVVNNNTGGDQQGTQPVIPPSSASTAPTNFVNLNRSSIELEVGNLAETSEYTLRASSNFSNLTWTSSDEAIATVENGLVKALKAGEVTITVSASNNSYSDTCKVTVFLVEEEETPEGAIQLSKPYISGFEDKTFRPKNIVTREQVASMLAQILDMNLDYPGKKLYNDVDQTEWSYKYVQAISRTGIFSGYPDGSFKPDKPVSRGEMASVILKLMVYINKDTNIQENDKVTTNHWAKDAINNMYNLELDQVYEGDNFSPEENVLREEIVYLINRSFDFKELLSKKPTFSDVDKTNRFYGDIEAASNLYAE